MKKVMLCIFAMILVSALAVPAASASGGELLPGDAEIVAEIEQRRAAGTADEFDQLIMDAMDGTMNARLEAMGLNGIDTRLSLEDPLRCILARGWDSETGFCVVLRFTPCAIGVFVGDAVRDMAAIPVSAYASFLRSPGMDIYENASLVMRSEVALAEQEQLTLLSLPSLKGCVGSFPRNRRYDVYRGPGKVYGRDNGGKAYVSTNGPITCYGLRDGWMLISYEVSEGQTRYGWISADELPGNPAEAWPQLVFPGDNDTPYLYAVITKPAVNYGQGLSVHCLAKLPDGILFEAYAAYGHSYSILKDDYFDMEHGWVTDMRVSVPAVTHHAKDDIESAMRAVAGYYAAHARGYTIIQLSYRDHDNRPENASWPTDVPDGVEWMKLSGSVRSISYHDLEIADERCIADGLVFYVWREPGGAWIGGLGGYE